MNITNERPVMIFKNEYNSKIYYNAGISHKLADESYENGTIQVKFKKDVKVENMTKITIKKAWLDFYKKDSATIPYIFISEFDVEK